MAHGMSSGKKMIGSSAVHAIASELLFRGYNISFPEFDMGRGDDLLSLSPDCGTIRRFQVRSRQLNRFTGGDEGASTEISIPSEITKDDYPLDYVAIALRYQQGWLLGLFNAEKFQRLRLMGVGSSTKHVTQDTYDLRVTLNKKSKAICFSGVDVTNSFNVMSPNAWDEYYPIRIDDAKHGTERCLEDFYPQSYSSALDLL